MVIVWLPAVMTCVPDNSNLLGALVMITIGFVGVLYQMESVNSRLQPQEYSQVAFVSVDSLPAPLLVNFAV